MVKLALPGAWDLWEGMDDLSEGDRYNEEGYKTFRLQLLLASLHLGPPTVRALSLTQIFAMNACGKIL